jgi:hypothetical protein
LGRLRVVAHPRQRQFVVFGLRIGTQKTDTPVQILVRDGQTQKAAVEVAHLV